MQVFFDLLKSMVLLGTSYGWLTIYKDMRFFQLQGYDGRRWLRLRFDKRYRIVYIVFLLIFLFLLIFSFSSDLGDVTIDVVVLAAPIAANIFLLIGIISTLRAIRRAKQKFVATSRAIRLLSMSVAIDAIPLLFFLVALSKFSNTSYNIAWSGFAAGISPYLVALPVIPFANILIWPVEETFRQYYLSLAKRNLKRCGATVIAITGSYGKTSTKHYLSHILEARYRVLMTPKSYNTLLGISRVINEILAGDNSYDYFLVEAGAYIPGEIARICKLVEPKISMVTAVGPMHLERFGSMENVVKAKYEIVEALPLDGVCVFNADDPLVRGMAERGYPQNRVLITRQGQEDGRLAAENVRMSAEGLDFDMHDTQTGETVAMHAPLYGDHNVSNILMAAGVAISLGLSLKEIGMRVATLEPAEHRLHRRVMPDGTILIDDAYSANPVGTQTALEVLALQKSGRRVVISSGMFELGPISDEENRKLGERIAAVATDVILIGAKQVEPVRQGLVAKGFSAEHLHIVDTLNEAVAIYRGILSPGDALLVLTDLPDTYA